MVTNGSRSTKSPAVLKVHDSNMKTVSQATYLGGVLSETGTIDETVMQRGKKQQGLSVRYLPC